MATSPARRAANRKNATKSTGPRTADGKLKSRGNALKHGLRSETLDMTPEDEAKVARQFDALAACLDLRDEQDRVMCLKASVAAIKLERCIAHEFATVAMNVRNAISDYDEERHAEVRRIANGFGDDPAGARRRLMRTNEGVDFLIDRWKDMREALEQTGEFSHDDLLRVDYLQGRRHDAPGISKMKALGEATRGDFSHSEFDPAGDLRKMNALKESSTIALDKLLGEQVEKLEKHRKTLDHEAAARDRAEAPIRALVDLSPRAVLYRRYESAASRELHKAFAHFDDRPAVPEGAENLVASRDAAEGTGTLGSFGDPAPGEAMPSANGHGGPITRESPGAEKGRWGGTPCPIADGPPREAGNLGATPDTILGTATLGSFGNPAQVGVPAAGPVASGHEIPLHFAPAGPVAIQEIGTPRPFAAVPPHEPENLDATTDLAEGTDTLGSFGKPPEAAVEAGHRVEPGAADRPRVGEGVGGEPR